ncbi:MAG: hypothetical protein FWD59_01415 [Micrococcales bacterium]|nr:hypothetical protein [Micrococcales bacterium]
MISLPSDDPVAQQLQNDLEVTEQLLRQTLTRINGRACDAEILPLPGLCLPEDDLRADGGFRIGAFYRWDSDAPFVPVDAAVSVCGVSVFRTDMNVSSQADFDDLIVRARSRVASETPYTWNLAKGNHFAILSATVGGLGVEQGKYLVLHASTAEFGREYDDLYPKQSSWFGDAIEVFSRDDARYLRFIHGSPAERFFETADSLIDYQKTKLEVIAQIIAEEAGASMRPTTCRPHYGMPDRSSLAIGCQWMGQSDGPFPLLAGPDRPVYLIEPDPALIPTLTVDRKTVRIAPHGLPATASDEAVKSAARGTVVAALHRLYSHGRRSGQ